MNSPTTKRANNKMLSPRYLDGLSDELVEIYSQLETDILKDMARRIKKLGKITDATKWQAQMLAEAGGLKANIGKTLKNYDKKIIAEVTRTYTEALRKNTENDNKIFAKALGRTVKEPNAQMMLATIQKCHSDLSRLTLTTAATTETLFMQQANRVYLDTQSGAFDYDTAMKSAADAMAERGITTVQYRNGQPVTLTIESAIRMNILTSVNQTAANMTLNNCEELGCDLVETSAHIGARPEHEEWQGQIFSRSGKNPKYRPFSVCGLGSVTGICGINCRHSFYPYFEGMHEHYTQDDLDEMANEKVTYNGKEMTRYEGEQAQRKIERQIRYYKRRALTQEAMGVDNTAARIKLGEWQSRARDFVEQTGLRRDYAREYIGTKDGVQPKALKPPKSNPQQIESQPNPFEMAEIAKNTTVYGNAISIEEAKSELLNFATDVYIPKDTNIENVNKVTQTLENLTHKFPTSKLNAITFSGRIDESTGAKANFEHLTVNKNIEKFIKLVKQPDKWREHFSNKIEFYKTKIAESQKSLKQEDLRKLKKYLTEAENSLKFYRGNVCYKGQEIETVISHEYGHILADQRIGQINHSLANKDFEHNKNNILWQKCQMVDDAFYKAKENGDIYKISEYGAKNSHEFFAESFAIYAMKIEKLPNYIIKMIEEVLK